MAQELRRGTHPIAAPPYCPLSYALVRIPDNDEKTEATKRQ